MRSTLILIGSLLFVLRQSGLAGEHLPETRIRVADREGVPAIEVLSGNEVILTSPAEGLWSFATDWRESWATRWHHVQPEKVAPEGPWTILRGTFESNSGMWRFRDAYRPRKHSSRPELGPVESGKVHIPTMRLLWPSPCICDSEALYWKVGIQPPR